MKHGLVLFALSLLFASSLADVCEDQRINTFETTFPEEIKQIVFSGSNNNGIYILSGNVVYFSEDGTEFQSLTDELEDFDNTFGTKFNGVSEIIKGAHDGLIYLVGASRKIYWFTRGDGSGFKAHPMPENSVLFRLLPHPVDGNLVLRLTEYYDTENQSSYKTLDVSDRQGFDDTWAKVRDFVYEFDWGTNKTNEIFMISVSEEKMNGIQIYIPIQERNLYHTDDNGVTFTSPASEGYYDFRIRDEVLYVVKFDTETQMSDLFISPDCGTDYHQATFNNNEEIYSVDASHFMVLGNGNGVSFLSSCVYPNITAMDLFQADLSDAQFHLNFPHIRGSCTKRKTDFQAVDSMASVYVTNTYALERAGGEDVNNFIKSVISFDKGGVWSSITAPADSEASYTRGQSLNIFNGFDNVPALYSTLEASGLVLANGNEGYYLLDEERSKTYFSRNGGFSWDDLSLDGTHHFALSQHGSLMTLIPHQSTDQLIYSWNQGETFDSCSFHDSEVTVTNFMDASVNNITRLMVEGSMDGRGYFNLIDFSDAVPRVCENIESAGSGDSDYEVVNAQNAGQCILGENFSVKRRKADVECVSFSEEIITPIGSCQCKREDFTCESGECWREAVDPENLSIICVNDCKGLPGDPEAAPENCIATYMKPSGYRKIENDKCAGGIDYAAPELTDCPIPSATPTTQPPSVHFNTTSSIDLAKDSHMNGFLIFFLTFFFVFSLMLLSAVTVVFLYKTNPNVHSFLNGLLPSTLGGGSGDTKQYSVLGDIGDASSLFGDDDMFLDENDTENGGSDGEKNAGSLLDFGDEQDEIEL